MFRIVAIWMCCLLFVSGLSAQDEQIVTGTLTPEQRAEDFMIYLQAGQVIWAVTEEVTPDLDPYLELYDGESAVTILLNRDYGLDTLQSTMLYQAPQDGFYGIRIGSEEDIDTDLDFQMRLILGDESLLTVADEMARVQFSGPPLRRETPNFIVHYTLEGTDATSEDFVDLVAETLEEAWTIQTGTLGWPKPPVDLLDDDPRYDVYLVNLRGGDSDTVGMARLEMTVGDNPNTVIEETEAGTSYIVLENDFSGMQLGRGERRREIIITTIAHELHHAIQLGLDGTEPLGWYYEATSVWMEWATYDIYTGVIDHVEDTFDTPEICLGAEEAYGIDTLHYGDWLLLQELSDRFGPDVIKELWQNIALYDGFDALERTLARYDTTMAEAIARYHTRNLVRDYDFADQIDDTVWGSNTIVEFGEWTTRDEGIQEMGVNYFHLERPPGIYDVRLSEGRVSLELWSVALKDDEAFVTRIGQNGSLSTEGFDYVYLMVYYPRYDDSPDECHFYEYQLEVRPGTGVADTPHVTFDASHFIPPSFD